LKIFAGLKMRRPEVSVGYDGSLTGTVEKAARYKGAFPALLEGMGYASIRNKKGFASW